MKDLISDLQRHNQQLQAEVEELRCRLVHAENELRHERQMFQAMAETLTDIAFTAATDGSWNYVNARLYEHSALPLGSALGNGWIKALHPDDRERATRDWNEALAGGVVFESHFRLQTTQGGYRRWIAQASFLGDDAGQIVCWIGTATDVHDLLTAEDALQEVKHQKRELLRRLAHDLRNAVAPIQNSLAVLRNPDANAAQKQRSVEIIDGQVRELRALLDAARVE